MSLHTLSAVELSRAIRSRAVTTVDAVEACFAQIERFNPTLKAMITLCQEDAWQTAQSCDRALDRGQPLGPLHGIPFTIKDLTPTAGIRTTFGSQIYADHTPTQNEICVARLRAAGGVLIGKTNTPEFGMGAHTSNALYGPTANPYDPSRSSGGSSGGAAVAVSTGMCHLAQGTDMGGSVRTPASFCAVVGLRPSAGRIPRRRRSLLWDYLDTDGILARSVEDAALMLEIMAGEDHRDPISYRAPWHREPFDKDHPIDRQVAVGYSPNLGFALIESEVQEVFIQAIATLSSRCRVIELAHPDCHMAPAAFETIRAAHLRHKQRQHYESYRDLLSESVIWNVERGAGITAAELLTAQAHRDQLYVNFLDFFQTYDVLATMSASVLPFPHTQPEILEIDGQPLRNIIDYLSITYTISLTGLPALSIPCGWTDSGLPVGMQLIGKPGGESQLLQFAYLLQEECGFRHRFPGP